MRSQAAYRCNISILFILLAATRNCKEEHNDPRDADFTLHLEVNAINARVEACTHEVIIEEIARSADLSVSKDGVKICSKSNTEAIDHSYGHEMAVIVDDFGEAENA